MIDVDVAEESARMAKYTVLTQASAAMVAQANSLKRSLTNSTSMKLTKLTK